MLSLSGYGRDMPVMCGGFFLSIGTSVDAAIATIETDAGDGGLIDPCVVDVVNYIDVHVQDRAVIEKVSVVPAPAFETMAKVTESIVDPAVETYLRAPIAVIENIAAVSPTPIAWSPEKTDFGSKYPSSRHPEIAVITVSPVSGRPKVTVAGAYRLFVNGQLRRSNRYGYADADLRERCGGREQHSQGEQQQTNGTNGTNDTHCVSFCLVILRLPGVALELRAARIARRDLWTRTGERPVT